MKCFFPKWPLLKLLRTQRPLQSRDRDCGSKQLGLHLHAERDRLQCGMPAEALHVFILEMLLLLMYRISVIFPLLYLISFKPYQFERVFFGSNFNIIFKKIHITKHTHKYNFHCTNFTLYNHIDSNIYVLSTSDICLFP